LTYAEELSRVQGEGENLIYQLSSSQKKTVQNVLYKNKPGEAVGGQYNSLKVTVQIWRLSK
jgi:hypothetical protein